MESTNGPARRGISLHLSILDALVRPLSRNADNTAAVVFAELERHLDIDAIKFGLRQRAQLAFTRGAGGRELAFLVRDLRQIIIETVLTDIGCLLLR